jgi:glycosyltransferase involved in cell wall biosynthesis
VRVLYIEPFHGGSHAAFGEVLTSSSWAEWTVLTLPARHWKWRMRGSAAWFARAHARELANEHELIFASAYLPLAELRGLCPDLARRPAVLYFHENQLAFPRRDLPGREHEAARDLHFGFTQLGSALAATRCVFNSAHNRDSFLDAGTRLLARMPDAVAPGWIEAIRERSEVLGLPLKLAPLDEQTLGDLPPEAREQGPLIVWNHRWEHDKGPELLVRIIDTLLARGLVFRLAVCGRQFRRRPAALVEAEARWRAALGQRLLCWGQLDARGEYLDMLGRAQLVLSTAAHEFFGISVLEAVHHGARPLVPDALSYPELLPVEYRYRDEAEAVAELERLIQAWTAGELELRQDRRELTRAHAAERVLPRYRELLSELVAHPTNG